jgi:hypothetical protein
MRKPSACALASVALRDGVRCVVGARRLPSSCAPDVPIAAPLGRCRALVRAAKPHAPRCVGTRAKRYNPDLGAPSPRPGSQEEDEENLREFVREARDAPPADSPRQAAMSVPVCGVTMTADKHASVTDVAQVSARPRPRAVQTEGRCTRLAIGACGTPAASVRLRQRCCGARVLAHCDARGDGADNH